MSRDHKIRLAVSHLSGTARELAIELLIHEPDQIKLWLADRMNRHRARSIRVLRPTLYVPVMDVWQQPNR